MHFTRSLLTTLAIGATLLGVSAETISQDALNEGVAEVLLNFEGTRLIPNLVNSSQLELQGLLTQKFGTKNVSVGTLEPVSDVASQPVWTISYSSAANTSGIFNSSMYTVMTLDPGAATEQPRNIVRHYLANNISLSSSGELRNFTKPIAGWFSPAPPAGSGVHRYTTLVFRQGKNFTLPPDLENRVDTINTTFNLQDYISRTNLGPIVAANFFLAQNNDTAASVTVSGAVSTTAVPAASISAAVSSVSSSLSAAYASASSGSSTGHSSAAVSVDAHFSFALLLVSMLLGAVAIL